jgi:hypothetical protein
MIFAKYYAIPIWTLFVAAALVFVLVIVFRKHGSSQKK